MAANFSPALVRNNGSVSAEEQNRLAASTAVIVGCGGLGGYVAEELCRVGVGHLTLFDPDVFDMSNCNRQLNALKSSIGEKKVEITAQRLANIGTGCEVTINSDAFIAPATFKENPPDVVLDCLDSIRDRIYLARQCALGSIPMVHGAVAGWYGRVGVQKGNSNLIEQMYPQYEKRKESDKPPSVLAFTVATIASLQVAEAVKVLLGMNSSLENTWMDIDLKNITFDALSLD